MIETVISLPLNLVGIYMDLQCQFHVWGDIKK